MKTDDFERLYAEHAQGLFGFLAYRTGDVTLAEDLVADTFERVLTARRPFDRRRASEKTWIYTIALNRLRDTVRRAAAERRAVLRAAPTATTSNGDIDAVGTRQLLMAALATLGDEEREALALRYGAELSLSEIAGVVKKPRSTVEGRIYRGLKRLREEIEEEPPAPRVASGGGGRFS